MIRSESFQPSDNLPKLPGDIFTAALDDELKWVFRKTRFTKSLSVPFDCNPERESIGRG
jgi:hypothetical protein